MRIIKNDEAIADIVEAATYIAEDNLEAALRFADAIDESLTLLAKFPLVGTIRHFDDVGEFRMWLVKGFPNYLIFYRTTQTEIILVRLIHCARDYDRLMGEGG